MAFRTHRWKHITAYSTKFLSREQSLRQHQVVLIRWREETQCRKKNKQNLEEQENGLVSQGKGDPAQNNPINIYTTQRLSATGELPSVAVASGLHWDD